MEQSLTSTRPYLVRAMHDWMSDNGLTPLVVVDATYAGVEVPAEHIKDGQIVLNVAWSATRNLELGNEFISFEARFNGAARSIVFPPEALLGIYARESGQGMQFEPEDMGGEAADSQPAESGVTEANQPDDDGTDPGPKKPKGPNLRLVK